MSIDLHPVQIPTQGNPVNFDVTVTGSGSPTLYASLTIAGTEQLPRMPVPYGSTSVLITPSTSGSATVSLYAAPNGGSALATWGAFTIAPPPPAAPGATTALTAGTPGSTSMPLSWTAPSSGGAVSSYTAGCRQTSVGGAYTLVTGITGTSTTISGLASSTSYDLFVYAVNAGGTGIAATASATTAAGSGGSLPLDSLVGTTIFRAISTMKLKSSATSCCRIARNSDGAQFDIGFGANGFLDTTALSANVASNDFARVVKWYDQSGAARDVVPQFAIGPIIIYQGTVLTLGANNRPAPQFGSGTNLAAPSNEAETFGATSGGSIVVAKPATAAAGQVLVHMAGADLKMASATAPQAAQGATALSVGSNFGANGSIVESIFDSGGHNTVKVDGTAGTAVASAPLTSGGDYFVIGSEIGNPPPNTFSGYIGAVIQVSGALNSTDEGAITGALKAGFGTP